ncbi:T9SS type A sorting domain-containing protein [Flavobacterium sp. N1994]|uniref:DUF7619 domain-containing protein n=1 Tax=Flavobacterium sp. N1994 TaxID=2986827 RepID=UPI0022224C72|nr:T9SS type A sorting domain-containing protein [Flavobacterium sp. N1994]
MKNTIYLILLLFAGMANATNIVFDGTVFKNKVLQSSTSNSIAKDNNGNNLKVDADGDNEISLTEANAVYQLDVSSASIVNLTGIESFTNLRTLDFHQNLVTTVELSALVNLQHLVADHNSLTTIDLSALVNLLDSDVSNNSLFTIYAKNGNNSDVFNFSSGDISNLSYICIDEAQVASVINDLPGSTTVVVNSYCTPTPGPVGSYETISGTIAYDGNGNGIDASDAKFPFVKVKCVIGADTLQTITDANGQYAFYTQQTSGSYTVSPVIETSSAFIIPTAPGGTLGANATVDFPITAATVPSPDLEVVVAPNASAVAGGNTVYQVTYKNKGSRIVNGNVLLTYDSSKTSIVSCSDVSASIATAGQVALNFSNLLPFETRSFNVTLSINAGNAVGEALNFNTTITDNLGATETTTAPDNAFNYKQSVGTVTQNTIDCLEGVAADNTQIGNYLHYRINFVNTGNAVAKNVTAKVVFDPAKYDMNSLQILNSSNPLNLRISGATAIFFMGNVNAGGPGGDGGILLKIKTVGSLASGSTVTSSAQLFFDYEAGFIPTLITPAEVTTNNAATTFQNLSIGQNEMDASILVYPNPTNSILNIDSNNSIKTVQLYDISGKLLQTNISDSDKVSMDMTQRSNGIYFLKITSDKGQKVEKIVKEKD